MREILPGVFMDKGKRPRLYTRNLIRGNPVYQERIISADGVEYREWDPKRSKLGAGILRQIAEMPIHSGDVVLYLGAASGTTVSHVSDIVGEKGFVFALDFAPRVVRDLVFVCEKRKNVAPLLEDAAHPEIYKERVSMVDVVFQDIAQKNQTEIFRKNCEMFLKKGGKCMLSLKARSVDVTEKPSVIFKRVKAEMYKGFKLIDYKTLEPFEMDHALFLFEKM